MHLFPCKEGLHEKNGMLFSGKPALEILIANGDGLSVGY